MPIYNPRRRLGESRFKQYRAAILNRIQTLIRKGVATSVDGERFRTTINFDKITAILEAAIKKLG